MWMYICVYVRGPDELVFRNVTLGRCLRCYEEKGAFGEMKREREIRERDFEGLSEKWEVRDTEIVF